MAVVVDSGPVAADDLLRHVPQERWRELMLARRRFLQVKLSYDCRCLVQFVNEARDMYAALEFKSVEAMIRDGYGLEPEEIEVAVEWLRLNPPADPISLDTVKSLAKWGQYGRSRPQNRVGNAKSISAGGSTRAYTLARLDRDGFTDLAAKVRAKELSANAAAQAAGFRKKLTPFDKVKKLIPKLSDEERTELVALLTAPPNLQS